MIDLLQDTPNLVARTVKRTNIQEDDDKYVVEVAIPGLIKDDLEIKVKESILSISHERDEDETFRFTNSFTSDSCFQRTNKKCNRWP